ncbi:YlcG family protein [Pantoea sp. S62]|nr:YlcG family protein [Pantoea sp. S62]MBK5014446.1 YlcG family protein [Pantoea sp. S62]
MTQYLREKWQKLRIYKRKGGFAVDYRIIHNMAKMVGVKHGA